MSPKLLQCNVELIHDLWLRRAIKLCKYSQNINNDYEKRKRAFKLMVTMGKKIDNLPRIKQRPLSKQITIRISQSDLEELKKYIKNK